MHLFILRFISCNNFSILVNLSKDFNNYRHTTNVLVMQEIFKKTKSVLLAQENIIYNKRNPKKCIYLDENTYISANIKTQKITQNSLMNLLMLNHKILQNVNNSSNLTIYLTGHGGELFMKILDREFLLDLDFNYVIRYLHKRVNKLLIIIDTCKAESLASLHLENVCYIVTSKTEESSVSMAINSKIGVATIDGFCKVFWEEKNTSRDIFLEDFVKLFTNKRVGSTVMFIGKEKKFKLEDFTAVGEDILIKYEL